jgi:hypothetical protein
MAIALPAYKLAMLPSYTASLTGRDMWFAVLLMLLVDVVVLGLIYLIKIRVGKLNYDSRILKGIVSVLAIAYALYFILQASVLTTETVEYLMQSFFDGNVRLQMIVPITVCAGYIAYKGEKTLGRCAEIFIWMLVITVVISAVFNSAELNVESVMPVLEELDGEKLLSAKNILLWFGDYLPFIFIDIKERKKTNSGVLLLGAVGISLAVSALFAVFTMQWGDSTYRVPNAFARLAGYNFISADVGKADWIAILNWIGSCVLKISLLLVGVANATSYAFGKRIGKYSAPLSALIVTLALHFFIKDVQIEYKLGRELWIVGAIMNVLIPIVLCILTLLSRKTERTDDVYESEYVGSVTDEDYFDEEVEYAQNTD